MLKYIFLFIVFSFNLNAAELQFKNEGENLNGLVCSGNCPTVKNGWLNFALDRSMKTNYRTEVSTGRNGTFDLGKEYWISIEYRLVDFKKDLKPEFTPMQLHVTASSWDRECNNFGGATNVAPFYMMPNGLNEVFYVYRRKKLATWPVTEGKTVKLVVHFVISPFNDGFIEMWKDGVKMGRSDGPNMPEYDTCDKKMQSPYMKYGVYKWNWKNSGTNVDRREIEVNYVRIANGANGYDLVSGDSMPDPQPEPSPSPEPAPVSTVTQYSCTTKNNENITLSIEK